MLFHNKATVQGRPEKNTFQKLPPHKGHFLDIKIDSYRADTHIQPLKSGQPLYSGQISWSQCVLSREFPLQLFSFLAFIHNSQTMSHIIAVNAITGRLVNVGKFLKCGIQRRFNHHIWMVVPHCRMNNEWIHCAQNRWNLLHSDALNSSRR